MEKKYIMRLNQYINEKEELGLGITFIDLDETLFNTFAKIKVVKDGKVIKALTNIEYNAYRAKDGEEFDFSDFRSAQLFYDTSKPIDSMIKRATRIIHRTEPKGSRVIILTARADLDDRDLFLSKFRKEGIPIDKAYVERAGNKKGTFSIPSIKKNIIMSYLSSGLYRRCRIFDDYLATCKKFLTLKKDVPSETLMRVRERYELYDMPDGELINFEAWHVQEDGTIKEV
jgi:hypothetical protein